MKSVALAKKNNLHIPRESSLTPTTLLSLLSLRIVGSGYPLLCQGLNIKKKKVSIHKLIDPSDNFCVGPGRGIPAMCPFSRGAN